MHGVNMLAIRLAATMPCWRGTISASEIRTLPFVETDEQAMAIARILAHGIDIATSASASWDDTLAPRTPSSAILFR